MQSPPRPAGAFPFTLASALAITAALATAPIRAQAHLHWKSGKSAPGYAGFANISATAWWDPDGAGPRQAVLVLGGSFTIPSIGATNLAIYDPASRRFDAFPTQPDSAVEAVATLPNGDLVIGGAFRRIGALAVNGLGFFDGAAWSAAGTGVDIPNGGYSSQVLAMAVLPNGDVVIGGGFTAVSGVATSGLARWDGAQWHALGAFAGQVTAMATRPNGNLVVTGQFPGPGYNYNANIAEWDGAAWTTYGGGIGAYGVAVAVLSTGDVVVTGSFNYAGGASGVLRIARWDGSTWHNMDAFDWIPRALLPLPNGELLAASVGHSGTNWIAGVAHWDGSQWSAYAPGLLGVEAMDWMPNGELVAVGAFGTIGNARNQRGFVMWNGTTWRTPDNGFDDTVQRLVALPDGDVVASGRFSVVGGATAVNLARWDGAAWAALQPSGIWPPWSGLALAATVDATGRLWMAGTPALWGSSGVAFWNGASWTQVGAAASTFANSALVVDAALAPIVPQAVTFGMRLVRWDGVQWTPITTELDGAVHCLVQLPNGDLIAGGDFLFADTTELRHIARWDGAAWQPYATGLDGAVRAIVVLPNGDLVAAGDFQNDGAMVAPLPLIARWDGTAWHPLGAGLTGAPAARVHALLVLPGGDLLAGGSFDYAGGYPARGIARWNGSTWSAVDGGVDGTVLALAQRRDGDVVAGGEFAAAGGFPSAHFAWLSTDRHATAIARGAGCAGSGSTLALAPISLPWLGAHYEARCTPVPPGAFGVEVLGLSAQNQPLGVLHPAAGPACLLLVSLGALRLHVPVNGEVTTDLAVPPHPALLGARLHQQLLVVEPSAAPGQQFASSNALDLTVGGL